MIEPKHFKLTRINPLTPNVKIEGDGVSFDAFEFNPSDRKRYIISVEVGDNPPSHVQAQLKQASSLFKTIFQTGTFMVVPARNGHPVIGIYELADLET